MNKQEFEEKIERTIEDAAAHMEERIDKAMVKAEQKIEMATDRFDKSVNRAAKTKTGKRIIFFVNLLIAVALFIGGFFYCTINTRFGQSSVSPSGDWMFFSA